MAEEQKVVQTVSEIIQTIKDTPDFKTLLENTQKEYWAKNIGEEVKNIYSSVDKTLEEVLGVKKDDTTKTTEFLRKHLLELKEKSKDVPDLEKFKKENEKLYQSQLEELQKTAKKYPDENQALKNDLVNRTVLHGLDSALAGKEYNPALGKDELDELLDVRKAKLLKNATILENGTVVFYRDAEKSKPFIDTLGNPMKAHQVVDEVFGSLFKSKKQGGNAPQQGTSTAIQGDTVVVDMSDVKTKAQFYEKFNKIMQPKGLAAHEESFLKIQRATELQYNVKDLPLK